MKVKLGVQGTAPRPGLQAGWRWGRRGPPHLLSPGLGLTVLFSVTLSKEFQWDKWGRQHVPKLPCNSLTPPKSISIWCALSHNLSFCHQEAPLECSEGELIPAAGLGQPEEFLAGQLLREWSLGFPYSRAQACAGSGSKGGHWHLGNAVACLLFLALALMAPLIFCLTPFHMKAFAQPYLMATHFCSEG